MSGLRSLAAYLVVVAVVAAGGCGRGEISYAPREAPPKPVTFVKKGMTEAEVIAAVGEPTRRGSKLVYPNDPIKTANAEQVMYWDNPQVGRFDVKFEAGRVTSILPK